MLPMVVAATDHKAFLGPDDLGAYAVFLADEVVSDRGCVKRRMPDIGDVAGKKPTGGRPEVLIVILLLQKFGQSPDTAWIHVFQADASTYLTIVPDLAL